MSTRSRKCRTHSLCWEYCRYRKKMFKPGEQSLLNRFSRIWEAVESLSPYHDLRSAYSSSGAFFPVNFPEIAQKQVKIAQRMGEIAQSLPRDRLDFASELPWDCPENLFCVAPISPPSLRNSPSSPRRGCRRCGTSLQVPHSHGKGVARGCSRCRCYSVRAWRSQ